MCGCGSVLQKAGGEKGPCAHDGCASDDGFVAAGRAKGCRLDHFAETEGMCLHILRRDNMSKSFPPHLLPDFMLEKLFGAGVQPLLES